MSLSNRISLVSTVIKGLIVGIKMGAHVSREPTMMTKVSALYITCQLFEFLYLIFYYNQLVNKIAAFFFQHGIVSPFFCCENIKHPSLLENYCSQWVYLILE